MTRTVRKRTSKLVPKKTARKAAAKKAAAPMMKSGLLHNLKRTAFFDPLPVALESYRFWRSVGYDHDGACAWLGNEEGEDSFDNTRVGDNQEAFGPAQHHQQRIDIIHYGWGDKNGHHPGSGIDIKTAGHLDQLKAIDWSTQNEPGYTKVKDHILRARGIRNKVAVIVNEYEHSRLQDRDISRRTRLAQYWAEKIPPHEVPDPT